MDRLVADVEAEILAMQAERGEFCQFIRAPALLRPAGMKPRILLDG